MQVLLEHDLLHDVTKTRKIDETHYMAKIYKAEYKNVHVVAAKIKKSMDKTHHIIPEVTPKMKRFVKHNVGVSAKQMKLKKLFVKQLMPWPNATGFATNESKLVAKKYKMKPHIMKSYKKDKTGQNILVNNVKSIMRTKMMRLQDMIVITTVTKMMSNALASSNSPCQSSPKAPTPKNISLGH